MAGDLSSFAELLAYSTRSTFSDRLESCSSGWLRGWRTQGREAASSMPMMKLLSPIGLQDVNTGRFVTFRNVEIFLMSRRKEALPVSPSTGRYVYALNSNDNTHTGLAPAATVLAVESPGSNRHQGKSPPASRISMAFCSLLLITLLLHASSADYYNPSAWLWQWL